MARTKGDLPPPPPPFPTALQAMVVKPGHGEGGVVAGV
jgi:hypothetical protein